MSKYFGDVIARARGLATRFVPAGTLDELRAAPDLRTLGERLAGAGLVPAETPSQADVLDQALRRHAANQLALLRRWAGEDRAPALAVVLDDEDRRSLRALARACVEGAPPDARLAGLLPTPSFPERALKELAHQSTLSALAGTLAAWRSPYAEAFRSPKGAAVADLAHVETAISRIFFTRARYGARRDGDLAAYLATLIDLENAWTARALASEGEAHGGNDDAARMMRELTIDGGTGALPAFIETALEPGEAEPERAVLDALIRHAEARRRLAPLSSAAVIEFALRLRRETILLADILWATALGLVGSAA